MKHLCIRNENELRLAEQIYRKLTENTTAMVFLYEHHHKMIYVFGYNASWLKQIIEEIGMNTTYPTYTLDNQLYYKIQKHHIYHIISYILDNHIELRII